MEHTTGPLRAVETKIGKVRHCYAIEEVNDPGLLITASCTDTPDDLANMTLQTATPELLEIEMQNVNRKIDTYKDTYKINEKIQNKPQDAVDKALKISTEQQK